MPRKSLLTPAEMRAAVKKHPALACSIENGVTTLVIPATIEVAEIIQAIERFAEQRERAITRNRASESASGVATFTAKKTALVALAGVLWGYAPTAAKKVSKGAGTSDSATADTA